MAILLAGVFLRTPPVQIQAGLSPASVTPAWPLIVNSAVIYALSFNIIFFIQELSLALLPFLRQRSPTLRLLVLWLAYHGLIMGLAQIPVGALSSGSDVGMR